MHAAQTDLPTLSIGAMIRSLRQTQSVTLADLASATNLSEATISRIETGRSDISAHNLHQVAARLGVDVARFFGPDAPGLTTGIRSITRRGTGPVFETPRFTSEVLSSDVTQKAMQPFINVVTVATLSAAGGCQAHSGEEFLHILEGSVELHSTLYAPLPLNSGDSIYFAGSMPHAYVNAGPEPARILVIISQDTHSHSLIRLDHP